MTQSDLEHIVAEVVRRLEAVAGASPAARSEGEQAGRRAGEQAGDAANGVLVNGDRVVSVASLDGRLDGLRRLVVDRKAIVTPALREELSRRGIELDRGGSNGKGGASSAISVVRFDAERAPSLHSLGLAEDVPASSVAAMLKAVADQLSGAGRLVVVLTRQTAVALCVLNRNLKVRAALATNIDSVRSATKSLAANVLVIDPSHLGRMQLAGLLRAFENGGGNGSNVPTELRTLLN